MSLTTAAWLVLAMPLAGSLIITLGGRVWTPRIAGLARHRSRSRSRSSSRSSRFFKLQNRPEDAKVATSSLLGLRERRRRRIRLGIYVDPLRVFMALVVSGVSTLIHLYSVGYMNSDRGYTRFFAYLNFFVFSMLLLVLAGNLALLIVGWAFVGAASYMLISYWYRRTTATQAGIKAFVINVVGDVGLVLGTFFIFRTIGVLDYGPLFHGVQQAFTKNDPSLVAGMLLILRRRVRQVRAGPAAHVAPGRDGGPDAGLRPDPRRDDGDGRRVPDRPPAPAVRVGADRGRRRRGDRRVTLLLAGTIGLAVTDLKRVIAYSTMSQIGYMIMAVSAAAYVGGFFHLMTHAFFKALLFMAAGSIISRDGRRAVARQDARLPQGDAVHVRLLRRRRPRAQRVPADVRLLLQGRARCRDRPARRLVLRALRRRLHRLGAHRHLHVAPDLPRVLG